MGCLGIPPGCSQTFSSGGTTPWRSGQARGAFPACRCLLHEHCFLRNRFLGERQVPRNPKSPFRTGLGLVAEQRAMTGTQVHCTIPAFFFSCIGTFHFASLRAFAGAAITRSRSVHFQAIQNSHHSRRSPCHSHSATQHFCCAVRDKWVSRLHFRLVTTSGTFKLESSGCISTVS